MKHSRLFLIGTGVGRDLRGFEAHIKDLFENVRGETSYEAYLVKAAGAKGTREISIPSIYRKSRRARVFGFLLGKNPYIIQNLSFFIGLIPALYRCRPTALYLGEPVLYRYLFWWRSFSGMQFRLVFYSGGNTVPIKMRHDDFLQLVTPVLIPLAVQRGVLAAQMKVIPHFINSTNESKSLTSLDKSEIRMKLGIPKDRLIILSVGAIDFSVKRMDYLINEVSKLGTPYFLILLGETELETNVIKNLAEKKLGKSNFLINRVQRRELTQFYQASDIFVLASLNEGFGLVTIEAMLQGLPVLVHQHEVARFVLGEMASYSDFSVEGNLTRLVEKTIPHINDPGDAEKRKKYVTERFSWATLADDYRQMLSKAVDDSAHQEVGG